MPRRAKHTPDNPIVGVAESKKGGMSIAIPKAARNSHKGTEKVKTIERRHHTLHKAWKMLA